MVCILIMCTVGSYAAFVVGNVVLGNFTLFLTFFIGIPFLVKPDTSRKNQPAKGQKMEKWKIMLLYIIIATAASLISARFANRVKNRTIGLVTGAVLTILGSSMLILNCWDVLSRYELSFHPLNRSYLEYLISPSDRRIYRK